MAELASTFMEPGQFLTAAQTIIFAAVFGSSVLWLRASDGRMRLAAVVLLASLTYSYQRNLVAWFTNLGLRTILVDAAWVIFWHATELLLVSKASRDDMVSAASGSNSSGSSDRGNAWTVGAQFFSAVSLLWKWRRIGTQWQIKNIPPHSSRVPTRLQSALQSLVAFVFSYLVMDLLTARPPPDVQMMTPGKEALFTRLSEVTAEEVTFRVIETPLFLLGTMIGVVMFYNLACLVAVLSGISTPDECLPMFGSVRDACSVRKYWGTFYHQGLRKAIGGPADHLVDKVFRLRRGTILSRYSRLLLAFTISGIIHHMGEIAMGIPFGECGQFIFFTSQALGIIIEDAVIALYNRLPLGLKLPRFLEYAIGYIWVFLWMILIGPYWFFPTGRYMNPTWDTSMPFSVVGWLFTMFSS